MSFPRLAATLLCAWTCLAASAQSARAADGLRVAVAVSGGEDAADWQAVLLAGLVAARPSDEWMERGELARLWTERENTVLAGRGPDAAGPVSVDRYVYFRHVRDARWIVELVDAASGRELGSLAAGAADVGAASQLVDAAVRLLDKPLPAAGPHAPRIAIIASADAPDRAALTGLEVRLGAALADSGLVVLDRSLTQELAVEHGDAARGFRASTGGGSLLGLDFWIELTPGDARLVCVRDGVVVATMALVPGDDAAEKLRDWALPRLGVPAAKAGPYLPQVETEALEPFFRGIALHDAGRFAEASGEFSRAYRINGRFREAYEWSARCYEALGIPEMAAAMRRYLATEFLENLPASTGRVAPVDGLTFLGVEAPDRLLAPLEQDITAISAGALAARGDLGLRLPDQLARLQREYDWMHAEGAEPGRGEGASPGLFTRHVLSGRLARGAGGLVVHWTLRDSLGLRPPVLRTESLAADPAQWRGQLGAWLAAWPAINAPAPASASGARRVAEPRETAEALAAKLASAQGVEAEELRLLLMRADPANALSIARGPGKADEPLASFLDDGRRDHVIAHLPPDHPWRRWLELMRALDYRATLSPEPAYSGRRLDTGAELERLAGACATDGAGLAARYYQLFFAQGRMPAAALAAACRRLRSELDARPDRIAEIHDELGGCIDALARLAALAAGEPEAGDAAGSLAEFNVPTDAPVLRVDAGGRLTCRVEAYAITHRVLAGLDVADRTRGARAQLAINGRGYTQHVYDPAWLKTYPHTPSLAFFVVLCLSDAGEIKALPIRHPDNWAEEKNDLLAGVEYVADTVEDGFARYSDPKALDYTLTLADALVGAAGNFRMRELITPAGYDALQARLASAAEGALARTGYKRRRSNPRVYFLEDVTFDKIRQAGADHLDWFPLWILRADRVRAMIMEARRSFATATKAADVSRWWWLAQRWETEEALTAPERADLLAPQTGDVLRLAALDPGGKVHDQLFNLGLMMLYGRHDPEAERIFGYLSKLPATMDTPLRQREEVANACFRLAQLYRMAGRFPEALAMASRGLALAVREDMVFYEHSIGYLYNTGGLASQFSRLLTELRFDPSRLDLPDRVACVRVPTANGDNPLLTVYYRRPPMSEGLPAEARHRVLLVIPVTNQDAFEYVNPESPWARFADDHGLVLVAPRFCVSDRVFRLDHRFTHAHFPEAWSGEAVLLALDEINRRVPIERGRLLIHGQTSGGGFATHFAAWRPDLVAAVSVVNGNWGLSRLASAGLKPPAAQRGIRFWVAANPRDNTAMPAGRPRFASAQEFTARLRDAGASVEWSEWPDENHTPSPAMEEAARAFLARQLLP